VLSVETTKVSGPQEFEKTLAASDTSVASFDTHSRTALESIQHRLHKSPAMVPLIILLLSVMLFAIVVGGRFFSPFTLTLILQQVAITGMVGIAQTLVVLTAGIDLSVGAIMVLSSVVMGQFAMHYGVPAPVAVAVGLLVGALCGFINGILIAWV
jgi:fructose transport system permease protein